MLDSGSQERGAESALCRLTRGLRRLGEAATVCFLIEVHEGWQIKLPLLASGAPCLFGALPLGFKVVSLDLRPIGVKKPILVLLGFQWEPQILHLSFLALKKWTMSYMEMSKSDPRMAMKQRKCQKDNWYCLHACALWQEPQ